MNIAILTELYPSHHKPSLRVFVHVRAEQYVRSGHSVQIFADPDVEEDEVGDYLGIPVLRSDIDKQINNLSSFRPDVVAVHMAYAGTPTYELALRVADLYPVVVWIHGYEAILTAFHGFHQGYRRLLSVPWDIRKLYGLKKLLDRSWGTVFVSNWIRDTVTRMIPVRTGTRFVIHNPVDTSRFAPCDRSKLSCQTPGFYHAISLRTLLPRYGLDLAVKAFAGLSEIDLCIVGRGDMESQLRALISRTAANVIVDTRYYPQADVPTLLCSHDVFVAPSRNESQGVAMCEAMACGLPVIATNVGGIPEFVRDGIDGYLVPPEDPVALRAAVEDLISDPVKMKIMGRDARQHIVDVCDGATIAAQELSVLEQAC